MADDPRANGKGTDTAALSAGVVAVAVTTFVTPGNYDPMSAAISVTLLAVIIGYVWGHPRKWQESVGVSAVLSLVGVPIFGFAAEYYLAHDKVGLLTWGDPRNCGGSIVEGGVRVDYSVGFTCKGDDKGSRVAAIWLIYFWLVSWGAWLVAERLSQGGPEVRRAAERRANGTVTIEGCDDVETKR